MAIACSRLSSGRPITCCNVRPLKGSTKSRPLEQTLLRAGDCRLAALPQHPVFTRNDARRHSRVCVKAQIDQPVKAQTRIGYMHLQRIGYEELVISNRGLSGYIKFYFVYISSKLGNRKNVMLEGRTFLFSRNEN
jgi:hypothetical protein